MNAKMKAYGSVVVIAMMAAACSVNSSPSAGAGVTQSDVQPGAASPDAVTKARFAEFIRNEAQSPEDYIVGKFEKYDVVFLGENHRISQNLLLLQALIPKLHAAGVHHLGWEFVDSHRQKDIDRLVNGERYDEALAVDLILEHRGLLYGHVEYADVLRAAWQVNRGVPTGGKKFRIVGLDKPLIPTDWSQLRPGEKGTDPQVRHRLFGSIYGGRDIHWAMVLDQEVLEKNEKVLVYAGAGHTATRFIEGRDHMTVGNYIHGSMPDRVFRVSLHGTEGKSVSQALEALMSVVPAESRRMGFDVEPGTPVGSMPSHKKGYLASAEANESLRCGAFTLADVVDGYIFLAPTRELKQVSRIEGLLTEATTKQINRQRQLAAGDRSLAYARADLERVIVDYDNKSAAQIKSIVID